MAEKNFPQWKRIYIQPKVPDELKALEKIANNLWWSWNSEAVDLFAGINPEIWENKHQNPLALLENLRYDEFKALKEDPDFMAKLHAVENQFDNYMQAAANQAPPSIAYFCMEYGLHSSLKIYSGGLGVLAGDYMKEASDCNVPMYGIGLLYRFGYFKQTLSLHGEQIENYEPQKFTQCPVQPVRDESGQWVKISVNLAGRTVYAKAWKVAVGRNNLYLLDADIPENNEEDRFITHQLYGGNFETRLSQEILLGVGGIRLIKALGLNPDVYHLNEGHAAFIGIERLKDLLQNQKLNTEEALEIIKSSSVFTTHTPVPAGHDTFHEDLLAKYWSEKVKNMGISWDYFLSLGSIINHNEEELFSMSHLAANTCQEINGVSKIHGAISRKMLASLYPGFEPDELHVSHVTNSVHYQTWTASEWQDLYLENFGKEFLENQEDEKYWEKIHNVPGEKIQEVRKKLKRKLIEGIKTRITGNMQARNETPRKIVDTLYAFDEDNLIFGFGRRFATYKRANLLFHNPERLAEILNNTDQPVQFLFAGKAHPADEAGQNIIKHIFELSEWPQFQGKIIFLEDYDMELAKLMVQGVDVWLNTPTRPLEASGTSGMKALMNGVINFSVLDGWWAEGYRKDAGWALDQEKTYANQDFQNELDAETLYSILENEIIPEYREMDENGIRTQWIARIKNAISGIAPHFTMKRMLNDYRNKFYYNLYQRNAHLSKNNYKNATTLAYWKHEMKSNWDNIEVVNINTFDSANTPLPLGEEFQAEITLNLNKIPPENIGMEVVFARKHDDGTHETVWIKEMEKSKVPESMLQINSGSVETSGNNNLVHFTCNIPTNFSGVFDYGFRIYGKNDLLAHKQDFPVVKWV